MNKTELISEIINVLDKAEQYDKLMITRVQPVASAEKKEEAKPVSLVDKMVMKAGRKKIVNDVVSSYWASVRVSKNEDTGVIDIQSYDSWVNKNVKEVPDYISKCDFIIYFDTELREMYEDKRDDALNRFEEE